MIRRFASASFRAASHAPVASEDPLVSQAHEDQGAHDVDHERARGHGRQALGRRRDGVDDLGGHRDDRGDRGHQDQRRKHAAGGAAPRGGPGDGNVHEEIDRGVLEEVGRVREERRGTDGQRGEELHEEVREVQQRDGEDGLANALRSGLRVKMCVRIRRFVRDDQG